MGWAPGELGVSKKLLKFYFYFFVSLPAVLFLCFLYDDYNK